MSEENLQDNKGIWPYKWVNNEKLNEIFKKESPTCPCGKPAVIAIVGTNGLFPRCQECINEVFGV